MYISIKLINKLFNCNIKHMLQGHACHVREQVTNEIDELRIKFALYINEIPNNESLIYLQNNSLIPNNIKEKLNSITNREDINKDNITELKNIIISLKKIFPANESEIKKLNFVYEIFQKSLKSISVCKESFDKDILTYNYRKLNDRIKSTNTNYKTKDFSIFKNAFYSYKIGNLEVAYNKLNKISYETWKNKNYLIHIISCSYQYHLGFLIENYYRYDNNISENIKNIIENYKNIETYSLIERYIKNDLKDVVKSVVDLSFFKNISLDIRKISDNFEEMFVKAKNGTIGFSDSLSTLYEYVYDAYCFISNNYVMPTDIYECSELFQQFIQTMIQAYAVNEIARNKEKDEFVYSGGMKCFDLFDLYAMIEFGKYENIKRLCAEYKINLFILEQDSVKHDIINVLENFYQNHELGYSIYNFSEKFKNLMFILSKIELDNIDIEKIINILVKIINVNLNNKIENYNFERCKIKVIVDFIIDIYNKHSNTKIFKTDSIEKFFILILEQISNMDYIQARMTDNLKLLYTLNFILNKNYKSYKLKNQEQIIKLFEDIKDIKLKVYVGSKILQFVDKKSIISIKSELTSLINELNSQDLIELLDHLLISQIIKPNKHTQNKILNLLKYALQLQITNNTTYYGIDSQFCVLDCILYLLRKNKWTLISELKSIIECMQKHLFLEFNNRKKWWKKTYKDFIDIINLYINIEQVDFSLININLLTNIDNNLLLIIKNYINQNENLKNKFLINLLNNSCNDKNISQFIIKFIED